MSYTTKSEQDIINDILLAILENVDDINDANVGSVLRTFVESIGEEIKDLYDALDLIYAGTRIDTAASTDLEQLGKLVGISRKAGTVSSGNVTFVRLTPASADFDISADSVVTTQPNIGSEQLRYTVNSSTTFEYSVSSETQGFVDGVFNYKLAERIVGNTSAVAITATVSGTSETLTNSLDFYILKGFNDFIVDVDTIVTIDACEATTSWSKSTDAIAVALSTDKLQGTYSLKLGKDGTSSDTFSYEKVLAASVSGTSLKLVNALKFDSQTTIDKIDSITVTMGSGGSASNSYAFSLSTAILSDEWKRFRFDITDSATVTTGTPSLSAINYIKIAFTTNNATDTIVSGNVLMDSWLFADTTTYEGDILKFNKDNTVPDTATDYAVDYTPLSKEVPVTSEAVGAKYNVNKDKIIYKVSNIPNINTINNYVTLSGGTDLETDTLLRARVLYASEAVGKATAESIRQAVLAVSGVLSCTVNDMPLTSYTTETHTFSSGVSTYSLDREVIYLDDNTSPTNVTLSGTLSATPAHTFHYGTDYVSVTDSYDAPTSQVEWKGSGDEPDDNTVFSIDYQVNALGKANVFVSGVENPLPSTVLASVVLTVDETKAAGIAVTVTEPTVTNVAVTATITADTDGGYTFAGIEQNISDAIYNMLNAMDIGEDVLINEIIQVIMNVTGVSNCVLVAPASDTTVDTDEIARPGTITLS